MRPGNIPRSARIPASESPSAGGEGGSGVGRASQPIHDSQKGGNNRYIYIHNRYIQTAQNSSKRREEAAIGEKGGKERERDSVCTCVFMSLSVFVFMNVRVCVCVTERERESVCVCVNLCAKDQHREAERKTEIGETATTETPGIERE